LFDLRYHSKVRAIDGQRTSLMFSASKEKALNAYAHQGQSINSGTSSNNNDSSRRPKIEAVDDRSSVGGKVVNVLVGGDFIGMPEGAVSTSSVAKIESYRPGCREGEDATGWTILKGGMMMVFGGPVVGAMDGGGGGCIGEITAVVPLFSGDPVVAFG
jgi:hypothetical protein